MPRTGSVAVLFLSVCPSSTPAGRARFVFLGGPDYHRTSAMATDRLGCREEPAIAQELDPGGRSDFIDGAELVPQVPEFLSLRRGDEGTLCLGCERVPL